MDDRGRRVATAFGPALMAARLADASGPSRGLVSVLRKKYRKEKGRSEWALLDSGGSKVLRWFGEEKPSDERVKKEEGRIQYFKHKGSAASRFAAVKSMAYGSLPSEDEFRAAFELEVPGGLYVIRGPRGGDVTLPVADGDYSADDIWSFVSGAVRDGDDSKMGFASDLLGTLGFVWG